MNISLLRDGDFDASGVGIDVISWVACLGMSVFVLSRYLGKGWIWVVEQTGFFRIML